MRVALYGKGILGQRAYEYLTVADGIDLVCLCEDALISDSGEGMTFADASYEHIGMDTCDIAGLGGLYSSQLIDAVIVATDNELLDYVTKRLVRAGIDNIALLPSYYAEYDIEDQSFVWIDTGKPRMTYVEYHISFHCNLKCTGCTHFSNIVSDERYGNLDSFCRDMNRLGELYWGIGKIRLMGGEPILNPELPKFLYAAREAFPDADIRVVSNGLMLRDSHTELLETMRNTAVFFDVSMYPPTVGSINNIFRICNEHGVKLTVTTGIEEFSAGMNLNGDSDIVSAYRACPSNHCKYLCDGHISTCVMPQVIDYYNTRFGLNIQPGDNDIIDIYEEGLDGFELNERLARPMNICRYCNETRRNYKWSVASDPQKEDWLA